MTGQLTIWKDILEIVCVISELWVLVKQSLKSEESWSLISVFARKWGTWLFKWLWPSALLTSVAACVGGWISSKRHRTVPDRAGVSNGNGFHRHGWIKIEKLPVEQEKATGESPPRKIPGFLSWSPASKAEKILYMQSLSRESLKRS